MSRRATAFIAAVAVIATVGFAVATAPRPPRGPELAAPGAATPAPGAATPAPGAATAAPGPTGGPEIAAPGAATAAPGAPTPAAAPSLALSPDGPISVVRDILAGISARNDRSARLVDMPARPVRALPAREEDEEAPAGPVRAAARDTVVQTTLPAPAMPATSLNFDGIAFPGVACNCAPPDTNGEAGATQYVQIVNEGYQVFNKSTGASVLGPVGISTIWQGFGGVCETNGAGDPIVLYDQLANRWLVSQFAGTSTPTDECIAISTTNDATGSYYRYDFHLGSDFFDYPHLAVWSDGYYMSDNVFNAAGTAYLGPQPFVFERAKMLQGQPATFQTVAALGGGEAPFLPADIDGSTLPAAGAPESFVSFPSGGAYKTWHFHVDWATPANTTWGLFASPAAAAFTQLCPSTRGCVPQLGATTSRNRLDGLADRPMFRLAYRNFGDHESVVGNFTVSSGGVAGIRWFELRGVTAGPVTVFQQSTFQPDTTWRWMGSIAMDKMGDIALGYSASSSSINPQIRYTGRLATDAAGSMTQGETTLHAGTGSQTGTSNRWGDYSAMTIDPGDDCTFWFTTEYYSTTSQFNWRTRIGSFKFSQCGSSTPTVPGAPTLNTAAPGNGQVALGWSAPSSNGGAAIDGYYVYRGASKINGGNLVAGTTFTDTTVTNGQTYQYTITAHNAQGESQPSNQLSATPDSVTVPGAPTLNTATAGNQQVALAWSAPSSNGGAAIDGYYVYRGGSKVNGGNLVAGTTFTDTTVTNGTTYTYTVTAHNSKGESQQSNSKSATPATVPGAPTLNTATAGNGTVALAWSAPASNGGAAISNYQIYRGTSAGGEGATAYATVGTVTTWTDTGASNGTTWYYKVAATNTAGTGAQSNERSASPSNTVTAPGAPLNLAAATLYPSKGIKLTWNPPSSNGGGTITGYQIWRSTASGAEIQITTVGNVTTWTDTTLPSLRFYYYKVKAVNSAGPGPFSNEASTYGN